MIIGDKFDQCKYTVNSFLVLTHNNAMMYNLHTESNNKFASSLGAGKFIYSRLNEYQNFNMVTKIVFCAKQFHNISLFSPF